MNRDIKKDEVLVIRVSGTRTFQVLVRNKPCMLRIAKTVQVDSPGIVCGLHKIIRDPGS